MPSFLVDEVRDHLALPGVAIPGKRVFRMTKEPYGVAHFSTVAWHSFRLR